MSSLKWITGNKARKWLWAGLAAVIAVQLYFVQELLAALLIFTVLFAIVAIVAIIIFVLDKASQRTIAWAEPQTKQAAGFVHRTWNFAEVTTKDLSKKLLHRLHSQTAR